MPREPHPPPTKKPPDEHKKKKGAEKLHKKTRSRTQKQTVKKKNPEGGMFDSVSRERIRDPCDERNKKPKHKYRGEGKIGLSEGEKYPENPHGEPKRGNQKEGKPWPQTKPMNGPTLHGDWGELGWEQTGTLSHHTGSGRAQN